MLIVWELLEGVRLVAIHQGVVSFKGVAASLVQITTIAFEK